MKSGCRSCAQQTSPLASAWQARSVALLGGAGQSEADPFGLRHWQPPPEEVGAQVSVT
jgi:hypothetical protein